MKIKAIIETICSTRDASGNQSWAFVYVDTATGKQIKARFWGNGSNLTAAGRKLGFEWDELYTHTSEIPKKQFKELVSGWEDAGCAAKDIAEYIKKNLAQGLAVLFY
jgi:hypothetical protein